MPGAGRSDSPVFRLVGVAVFAVGGWVLWDWSFGDGLVPTALGLAAVLVAVVVTAYRWR